jgi:hypothetical protein
VLAGKGLGWGYAVHRPASAVYPHLSLTPIETEGEQYWGHGEQNSYKYCHNTG